MEKPWEHEPNEKTFEYRGYFCYIARNASHALCGYVGIKTGQIGYKKDLAYHIDAHGGITFIGSIPAFPEYWFIGFDCGHSGDLSPGTQEIFDEIHKKMNIPLNKDDLVFTFMSRQTYRTIEYVTKQIENMVDQLHEKKWDILFE